MTEASIALEGSESSTEEARRMGDAEKRTVVLMSNGDFRA